MRNYLLKIQALLGGIMITHLACIMDGNRRYAKQKGQLGWFGHRQGVESVKLVADYCLKNHISYLSLYAFSLENLNRSEIEKNYLFDLLIEQAQLGIDQFVEKGIRICFAGEKSLYPNHILPVCNEIEKKTASGTDLQITFLFFYGGRQEIIHGIKRIINEVKQGILIEDHITESSLKNYLWTGNIPDPELIIRTGKVKRLSNFLLYQSAYSELYFLDCFWPELTENHLNEAITFFNACKRNFGQ